MKAIFELPDNEVNDITAIAEELSAEMVEFTTHIYETQPDLDEADAKLIYMATKMAQIIYEIRKLKAK